MSAVFSGVQCRECGKRTLHLEWRDGGQTMLRRGAVVQTQWPWCVCYACGAERPGLPPEDGSTDNEVDPVHHRQHFYDRVFRRDLEALRDYYDTHDTSAEMEHGEWERD